MRVAGFVIILMVVGVGLIMASTPSYAQAQAEYPNVAMIEPFSAQANFMSLPGYLRLVTYRDQQVWLTYSEATRIVISQGGSVSPQAQRMAQPQ